MHNVIIIICNCIIFERITSLQQSWRAKQLNAVDLDAVPEEEDDNASLCISYSVLHFMWE